MNFRTISVKWRQENEVTGTRLSRAGRKLARSPGGKTHSDGVNFATFSVIG